MIFGQVECCKCGNWVPSETVITLNEEVAVGRSGPSFGGSSDFQHGSKAKYFFSAGRKFYKFVDRYYCTSCYEKKCRSENNLFSPTMILFIGFCGFIIFRLYQHFS